MLKKTLFWISNSVLLCLLIGCTENEIADRESAEEKESARQQKELYQIDHYSQEGKVILTLRQINSLNRDEKDGVGWQIIFTDGTEMTVTNGQTRDMLRIPFLRINGLGEWTVAYDGNRFQPIKNQSEKSVMAFNSEFSKNNYRKVSLLNYAPFEINFEVVDQSTGLTVDNFTLSNEESDLTIIKCIIQDDISREIVFVLGEDKIITFPLAVMEPEEILILNEDAIVLNSERPSSTFDFKVLPENYFFNHNIESAGNQIQFVFSRGIKALNNGTYPIKVKSIESATNDNGDLIEGQYTVTIEDSGDNILAYDEDFHLTLNHQNDEGEIMSFNSENGKVVYESEYPFLNHTGLPIVVINIPNNKEITSKVVWTEGVEMKIYDESGKLDYEGTLQMKGRGNSTWWYKKKPYALKLDSKSKILGMKKHKRWCLLANYRDRTLMRNDIAFEISKQTAMEYTPSGRFIELIVNGTHRGNYYLTEQIKVDENRLNIAELDLNVTEGEGITGGYIFEIDANYDEVYKFRSSQFNLPWMFKDPDEVNNAQFNYVTNYVTSMENAIQGCENSDAFLDYIDVVSFADWFIIFGLTGNTECYWVKSVYMFKDKNGKMSAGPVWDFDWSTFTLGKFQQYIHRSLYYPHLLKSKRFVAVLKERWNTLKPKFGCVPELIDKNRILLQKSESLNYAKWGRIDDSNNNGDITLNFNDACQKLKQGFEENYLWLDEYINNL